MPQRYQSRQVQILRQGQVMVSFFVILRGVTAWRTLTDEADNADAGSRNPNGPESGASGRLMAARAKTSPCRFGTSKRARVHNFADAEEEGGMTGSADNEGYEARVSKAKKRRL